MKRYKQLLWIAACTTTLAASSAWAQQWQWLDNNGNKVFSDRAPPPEIPESNILKQPKSTTPRSGISYGDGNTTSEQPKAEAAPVISGKDKALEAAKAKADAEEAAKKKKEDAERAKMRAENCKNARSIKTTLQSGKRLNHINDKGERVTMDDATRTARLRQAEKVIASDCK